MVESFDEKLFWLKRIKSMILLYQQDITYYEAKKKEAWHRVYLAMTLDDLAYDYFDAQRDYNEIVTEIYTAKQFKKEWINLYYRDLRNL